MAESLFGEKKIVEESIQRCEYSLQEISYQQVSDRDEQMGKLKDKILSLRDRAEKIENAQEKLNAVVSNFLKIQCSSIGGESTETTHQIDKNVLSEVISSLAGIPLKNGVFLADNFLQKDGEVLRLRLVCKQWKKVVDEIVLNTFVQQLVQNIDQIPTNFGVQEIVMTFVDRANPKNQTTLQIDVYAYQKLHKQIEQAVGQQAVGPLTSVQKIKNLVKEREKNLRILWDAIKDKVFPPPDVPLKTYKEISEWMHTHPEALQSITNLILTKKKLTSLPSEIGLFTQLLCLFLGDNQLETLPKEIEALTKLRRLSLNNNKLQSLPEEIGALTYLETLSLDNNQIESLTKGIESLICLEILSLDNNRIKSLPEGIGSLTKLRRLHLNDNKLESLPEAIGDLIYLETLSLENNPLLSIDNKVLKLFLRDSKLTIYN